VSAAAPNERGGERRRAAGAIDPQLVRYARATRPFIAASVALGFALALLLIAQAWLIATIVCAAFQNGRSLADEAAPLAALLGLVIARGVVAWGSELTAARASARAKSELRMSLLAAAARDAADPRMRTRSGEVAILATRGIDALDGYFSLYLPQLVLAVLVPVTVVVAVAPDDWVSAAIIAVTVPLVPLFMALVGLATRERTDAELHTLERLAGHFLDAVAGLATLKVFGRARAQGEEIARITDLYRRRALATLRVTFLSGLTLELVASVSVALVAVAIGLRLLDGTIALKAGLFALILAPEAYAPLRRLGANYHASAEGLAAAHQAIAVIEDAEAAPRGVVAAPDAATSVIAFDGVTFTYPGRAEPAVRDVSFTVEPGEHVALVGPTGCGKSTLLALLLGLVAPDEGDVTVAGLPVASLDLEGWHHELAWVPQRPHMFHASLADNVRLGTPGATDGQVRAVLAEAGLADVVARLPDGAATMLGERGAGLSAGERQRVALARALLRDAPLLLLDEPTAALDGESERAVLDAVARATAERTVLLVAHRPALVELADRTVEVGACGVRT